VMFTMIFREILADRRILIATLKRQQCETCAGSSIPQSDFRMS